MSILLIAGSPSEHSRSAALLDAVAERLDARHTFVDRLHIRDLSPQALLLADTGHPSVMRAVGSRVDDGGRRITAYLSRSQSTTLLRDIARSGRLAAVFSQRLASNLSI